MSGAVLIFLPPSGAEMAGLWLGTEDGLDLTTESGDRLVVESAATRLATEGGLDLTTESGDRLTTE